MGVGSETGDCEGRGTGGAGEGVVGKWLCLTWTRFGHKWNFLRFGTICSFLWTVANRISLNPNVGEAFEIFCFLFFFFKFHFYLFLVGGIFCILLSLNWAGL